MDESPFGDIHSLFTEFNERHFGGLLDGTTIEWSQRMTLCAGICYLRSQKSITLSGLPSHRTKNCSSSPCNIETNPPAASLDKNEKKILHRYCIIRLSAPILQFRPFNDTISTLLHEMIHAYLWVTNCKRKDLNRDGHGSAFLKMAEHINRAESARNVCITVFHTFHDEVEHHRFHIWRCSGACRQWAPFYGYVKRAMNRPPQITDRWFPDHQARCGGTFSKISPEKNISKLGSMKKCLNASNEHSLFGKKLENYSTTTTPTESEKFRGPTGFRPFSGKSRKLSDQLPYFSHNIHKSTDHKTVFFDSIETIKPSLNENVHKKYHTDACDDLIECPTEFIDNNPENKFSKVNSPIEFSRLQVKESTRLHDSVEFIDLTLD